MTLSHIDQPMVWKDRVYIKYLLSSSLLFMDDTSSKNKNINRLFSFFFIGKTIYSRNASSVKQRHFFKKKVYSVIQLYRLLKQQLDLLNVKTIKQHDYLFKKYSISLLRSSVKEQISSSYEDDVQLLSEQRQHSNRRFRFSRFFLRRLSSYVVRYNSIVTKFKLYVLHLIKRNVHSTSMGSYKELLNFINKLFIRIKKRSNMNVNKMTRFTSLYPFLIYSSPFLDYKIKFFLHQRSNIYCEFSCLNPVKHHFYLDLDKRMDIKKKNRLFSHDLFQYCLISDFYVPFFRVKYLKLNRYFIESNENDRSLYSFFVYRAQVRRYLEINDKRPCDLYLQQVSFLSNENFVAHHFFSYLSTCLPKMILNLNVLDSTWKRKETSFVSEHPMFISKNQVSRYRRILNSAHFSLRRSHKIRYKKKRIVHRYRTLYLRLNVRNSNIFITLRTKKKVLLTRWSGLFGFKKRLKVQKNAAYQLASPFIKYIINRSQKNRMKRLIISVKGSGRFFYLYIKPFRNMIKRRLKLMKRHIRYLRLSFKKIHFKSLTSLHRIKPYLIESLVYKSLNPNGVNNLQSVFNFSYDVYNLIHHNVMKCNLRLNEEREKMDSLNRNLMLLLESVCPHLLKIISTYILYTQLTKPSWSKNMVNTYLNKPLLSYQDQLLKENDVLIKDVASFFYYSFRIRYIYRLLNKKETSYCLRRYYKYCQLLNLIKRKVEKSITLLIKFFRLLVIDHLNPRLISFDRSFQRTKIGPSELYSVETRYHTSDIFNLQRLLNSQKKIENSIKNQMRRRYLYMKQISKLSFSATRSHGGCPTKYKLYDRYYQVFDKENKTKTSIRFK